MRLGVIPVINATQIFNNKIPNASTTAVEGQGTSTAKTGPMIPIDTNKNPNLQYLSTLINAMPQTSIVKAPKVKKPRETL